MWSGDDDDVNHDTGEHVRLYQPILYGKKPTLSHLSSSFIGGQSTSWKLLASLSTSSVVCSNGTNSSSNSSSAATKCPTCQDPLKQLVQLYIPKSSNSNSSNKLIAARNVDRTVIVSACNRASCIAGLFTNNNNKDNSSSSSKSGSSCNHMFAKGGGNGVIVCRRYNVESDPESMKIEESKVIAAAAASTDDDAVMASADDDDDKQEEENDWAVDDVNDMDDLEAKLASMESNTTTTNSSSTKTSSSRKKATPKSSEKSTGGESTSAATVSSGTSSSSSASSGSLSFPCFGLHAVQEPPARRVVMDEDDVGICASGASNDKIQQMLKKYMEEEEDEDILAMLRNDQAAHGSDGNNANISENDPGVSPQDRALLRFSDRLQRSPRQVLRYAYNGQPMWSVPLPSSKNITKGSRKQQGKKTRNDCDDYDDSDEVLQIPPCSNCGAPRVFEVQILPSILHVLDVDRYAPSDDAAATDSATCNKAAYYNISGGLDIGNIAIYTCSAACHGGQEEYVVVQDSVDKLMEQQTQQQSGGMRQQQHVVQEQRRMYSNNEVVVIPENSQFDDNDET